METRLQKYLAEAGVASRRKCEELIRMGRVQVNDIIVTEMGVKVGDNDRIKVNGKEITQDEKKVYIILNKPVGYITTARDQFSRKAVLDLINGVSERIYPVGRLDYDTSGLLILTNDGELAYKLTHPGSEIKKVYHVKIKGIMNEHEIHAFKTGLRLDDIITAPAKIRIFEQNEKESWAEVTIHEGRNRQIRRMFEVLGHTVLKLRRVAIGPVGIDGIDEGAWRHLRSEEVSKLKRL